MLAQKLEEMGREVMQAVPFLNQGGCCVYAALVGGALQRKGYRVTGRSLAGWDSGKNELDETRAEIGAIRRIHHIRDVEEYGLSLMHVVLQLDLGTEQIMFDAKLQVPAGRHFQWSENYSLVVQQGELSVAELSALAGARGWNRQFNRRQIPKMARIIQHHMRGVPRAG